MKKNRFTDENICVLISDKGYHCTVWIESVYNEHIECYLYNVCYCCGKIDGSYAYYDKQGDNVDCGWFEDYDLAFKETSKLITTKLAKGYVRWGKGSDVWKIVVPKIVPYVNGDPPNFRLVKFIEKE